MAFGFKRFQDPRKVITGTSYTATGTTPVDPKATLELGSSYPARIPDVVPAFTSRQQMLRTFKEMEDGDATFDISLRAIKTPIMGSTFFMQPFDQKQINVDIAEFCEYNIFEGTSKPFVMVLDDILRMFNDGYSVIEQVWEAREWAPRRTGSNRKTYTMLKKLASRPVLTIKEIDYDDSGGPIAVIQNAIRSQGKTEDVSIPIDKCLIFTFGGLGGDLTGKPIGRTAYQPWYFKKELYKIDAIGHERNHLGVPVWNLPTGYNEKDVEAAWTSVTNLRTNEKTGAVEPPGFTFRFEEVKGQRTDIIPSIEHHDSKILLNVMAQFLMLGLTGGGGRATAGSQVDMFQKSVKYFAEYICGVFNLYCIPKLVGYNFATSEFPQMRVRNVGETKDLQMWASAHANLIHEGAITIDDNTEDWYRDNLDMPYLTTLRSEQTVTKPKGNKNSSVIAGNGTGNTSPDPGFEVTAG